MFIYFRFAGHSIGRQVNINKYKILIINYYYKMKLKFNIVWPEDDCSLCVNFTLIELVAQHW